jgi:hypothetical protein
MQAFRLRFRTAFACSVLGLGLGGAAAACHAGAPVTGDEPREATEHALTAMPDRFERVLGWGNAEGELRLSPKVAESVSYGPNAVALLPSGEALILDRLAGRVVRVDHENAPRTVAQVAVDTEDLVAGPGGAFVAFSPLHARASFYDRSGTPTGELAVPRELRELVALSLGPSRRLSAHTAYQETLSLGSPTAPLPLPVVLHGRREGARLLADGRGLAVRAKGPSVELLVLSQAAGDDVRSAVDKIIAIPGAATAARLIGAEDSVACARVEKVEGTTKLAVSRRAVCLDVVTGSVLFDEPLEAPEVYVPRTELAYSNGRLAFIRPTTAGLVLRNFRVVPAHAEVAP